MDPYLTLSNITKTFNGFYALKNVSIDIYPGEVHCIAGQNGCGKSTVIKIISGVHKPDAGGTIRIGSKSYESLTPIKSVIEGVQVIYQDLSLFPNMSVAENIMVNSYHHEWFRRAKKMREEAKTILTTIGSSLSVDINVSKLSISQCQVVAIARALAEEAKLIIMDEPTASLTSKEVASLLTIVKKLKSKKIAIIFVSHKLDEVMEVSDKFSILKDGELLGTFPSSDMDIKKLGNLMTGMDIVYEPLTAPFSDKVVLECRSLAKKGQFDDVSFKLRKGEVLAITGLLGSGRTELCLSLFGLNFPDRGEIYLEGECVKFKNNQDAINAGIGYVSEDRMGTGLVMEQSISDNISSTQFKYLQPKLGLFNAVSARELVNDLINELNIKVGDIDDEVNTLSGGNAQRVSIAKWLATNPKVLILDSPTIGVDIANKSGIYKIIHSLSKNGVSIIIVTDEVEEAITNSHSIIVLSHGVIKKVFDSDQISQEQLSEVING